MGGFGFANAQTPARKTTVNTASTNAKTEKVAEIKFETVTHDFGTITGEEPVKCVFTFTNTGDAPLVIHQAIATCGCTVPNYSKDPVKPGEKGQIDVTYNGRSGGSGRFMKGITVRSNAKTNPVVRLTVEGEVAAPAE